MIASIGRHLATASFPTTPDGYRRLPKWLRSHDGIPKIRDGVVEAVRALCVVRRSAVKARPRTINQIRTLVVTAPGEVRENCVVCPRVS
ncbi:hypothetical protein [Kitasatospora sp. NPDC051914]|uniref:hypothetical protein n=1 Tax=Kitasatospora sp. NPDC051914 TaxID=3154945 RepID=UPI00341331DE